MVNIYEFEIYDYVCANQDGISRLLQQDYSLCGGSIDSQITDLVSIEETVKELIQRGSSKKILVWDMRRVSANGMRSLCAIFSTLYEKTYRGVLFLSDRKMKNVDEIEKVEWEKSIFPLNDRISEAAYKISKSIKEIAPGESEKLESNECEFVTEILSDTCLYCGFSNTLAVLNKHIGIKHSVFSTIDDDINKYIYTIIKTNKPEKWEPNDSSNVYVNRYFDAKKILTNGSIYNLVINRMALMIQRSLAMFSNTNKENMREFDAFICASITGACLAAGLSAIYKKPVVYVKNVGPRIMANDGRTLARIKQGNRYVLIFDFMCLGKEYERMKMICDLCSAKVVCCAGISYYKFPRFAKADKKGKKQADYRFDYNKNLSISSLFQVNAYDKKYYQCDINHNERK
ncbi:hypothetical protein JRC49_09590 [Clostridiales bacterium FE2011]|nr:hypothetical protein JRC49_09590 [Clostridiales bacterium FE2011]